MISKVALFARSEEIFAVPAEGILQILPAPAVFPLPRLREGFLGVFLNNGEVVPLFDHLGSGAQRAEVCPASYVVVCSTECGPVGLPVEQVIRIVDRGRGTIEEVDADSHIRGCRAFFVYGERTFPLLDVGALVAFQSCGQR